MFSVVIPVYNKEHCLATTLRSVLDQSYQDYELLLVDDGSTDRSIDIINQFEDPRITLITQANSGVSVARNTGIKNSKHRWIAFLDADDWWHPEYLQHLFQVIKQTPAAQTIASGFYCIQDAPDWQPTPWPLNPPELEIIENLPTRWMQGIPFFTSSICVKREFLMKQTVWFQEGESKGEDLDLWFRLAEQAPIHYLNLELVAYRVEQAGSLSERNSPTEESYFIKQMVKRLQNKDIPRQLRCPTKVFIAQEKLLRARQYLVLNNRKSAIELILKALAAIKTKRWWMTLFMALFLKPETIKTWNQQRSGRKEIS